MTAFAAFDLANFLTVLGGYIVSAVTIFFGAIINAIVNAIIP